jgi:hypothetical protein
MVMSRLPLPPPNMTIFFIIAAIVPPGPGLHHADNAQCPVEEGGGHERPDQPAAERARGPRGRSGRRVHGPAARCCEAVVRLGVLQGELELIVELPGFHRMRVARAMCLELIARTSTARGPRRSCAAGVAQRQLALIETDPEPEPLQLAWLKKMSSSMLPRLTARSS